MPNAIKKTQKIDDYRLSTFTTLTTIDYDDYGNPYSCRDQDPEKWPEIRPKIEKVYIIWKITRFSPGRPPYQIGIF